MKLIFRSETHLGDCLLHAHYMRKLVEKNKDIEIDFHLIQKHWDQTKEYIDDIPQIKCLPYDTVPQYHFRGWVGQFGIPPLPFDLNILRLESYKRLSNLINVECPFSTIDDLLFDHPNLNGSDLEQKFDVLLINSEPLSNQTSYNSEDYEKFVNRCVSSGYSIITTKKIHGIPCTLDYNLSIMGIGRLSTKCRVIVGINTGPLITCLNIWNKTKKIISIDSNCYLNSFSNVKITHSINNVQL